MNQKKTFPSACVYRPGTRTHTIALIQRNGLHERASATIVHRPKDPTLSSQDDFSAFVQDAEQHLHCDLPKVSVIVPSHWTTGVHKPNDHDLEVQEIIYRSGPDLVGNPYCFLASKQMLADVVRSFNATGLQVKEFFDERQLLSDAWPLLLSTAKNMVFADITERKTCVHVNTAGDWLSSMELPLGSEHFVHDLRSGLNIGEENARAICFELGLSADSFIGHNLLIEGQNWRNVVSVLAPRAKELASLMAKSLIAYKGQLDAGVYVAGVGAMIPGLSEFLADLLRIKVDSVSGIMRQGQELIETVVHADGLTIREPNAYFCHIIHASMLLAQRMQQDKDSSGGFLRSSLKELSTWLKELS